MNDKKLDKILYVVILILFFLVVILSISLNETIKENKKLKQSTDVVSSALEDNFLIDSILEKDRKYSSNIIASNSRDFEVVAELRIKEVWSNENGNLDNLKLTKITLEDGWEEIEDNIFIKKLSALESIKSNMTVELVEENEMYKDANYKLSYNVRYKLDEEYIDDKVEYSKLVDGNEINSLMKRLSNNDSDKYLPNDTIKKIMILNDDISVSNIKKEYNISASGLPVYLWYEDGIVYLYTDAKKIYLNEDSSYLFHNLPMLKEINGMDLIDTSKVKNMRNMFDSCGINNFYFLKYFDTSRVEDMSYMFSNVKTDNLDLSTFDTTNVEDMSNMFNNLEVESLNISNFDTSNVKNMSGMFHRIMIYELNLSNFNTKKVKNMSWMFADVDFQNLDLSNFDTSNVTNMYGMFFFAKIRNLNLRSFNTSKVENMGIMFEGFKSDIPDLSSFDTSNVTDMNSMFSGIHDLSYLDISSFDFSKVDENGIRSFVDWSSENIVIIVKDEYSKNIILKGTKNLTDANIKIK